MSKTFEQQNMEGNSLDKKAIWSSVSGKSAKNPENLQSSAKKSVTNARVSAL